MRLPILCLVVAVSALAGASQTASAQSPYSYPWCAKYYGKLDGTGCYYKSYQQCMVTISGIGGYCYESPYYRPELAARVRQSRH
jgi:Protein of unknown function (DUF3551)